MKKSTILPLVVCAALLSVSCNRMQDLAAYADPMVGTAYTGHTFPGAAYPFGFVQPSPQTGNFGWEHCSGYNNDDALIWGFGQNHLNGTGVPDLGDLMMMPFSRKFCPDFRSAWDKETELAEPGYYMVSLTDNNEEKGQKRDISNQTYTARPPRGRGYYCNLTDFGGNAALDLLPRGCRRGLRLRPG